MLARLPPALSLLCGLSLKSLPPVCLYADGTVLLVTLSSALSLSSAPPPPLSSLVGGSQAVWFVVRAGPALALACCSRDRLSGYRSRCVASCHVCELAPSVVGPVAPVRACGYVKSLYIYIPLTGK